MFGKKFSEYIQFERWLLILIAVVFAIRLGMSLAGVSFTTTRWVSLNIVQLVGLIYLSIAVHTTGFGSYKQLFGTLLIQSVFAHLLIVAAIILGIVTGTGNAYTTPEVFGGANGATWTHVAAHLFGGFMVSLIAWLIGSVIFFVTKKVQPARI